MNIKQTLDLITSLFKKVCSAAGEILNRIASEAAGKISTLKGVLRKLSKNAAPRDADSKKRGDLPKPFDILNVLKSLKHFFSNMSEVSVFSIWAAVIMLAAVLVWGLSTGLRDEITVKTVNKFLSSIGESRSVARTISPWHIPGNITQLGKWYTMTSGESAVICPLITEGIFSPCLAIIDNEGRLSTLIPLTVHGDRILSRVNPGYLRIWIDKIEKNAAVLNIALDKRG
ncbi:MAG: hypothetical protein LBH18_02720 [Spirochaetaceae bacterium]|jgi:hypothetical protein|nr:hypothetical protein [Spirochaetaceae bacterium]